MASTKTTICFSLALLATVHVISITAGSVGPYCDKAADKALCTQLTKGAKNWEDAMTNALNAVINKAKAAKPTVDGQLPLGLKPITKQSIDSTCDEAYEGGISNLEECVGLVTDDSNNSLNARLSAASTSLSDCTDALEEFGINSPSVEEFGSDIFKMNSVLLAVATQKED